MKLANEVKSILEADDEFLSNDRREYLDALNFLKDEFPKLLKSKKLKFKLLNQGTWYQSSTDSEYLINKVHKLVTNMPSNARSGSNYKFTIEADIDGKKTSLSDVVSSEYKGGKTVFSFRPSKKLLDLLAEIASKPITESKMTDSEARSFMGFNDGDDLDKLYKKLSMKYHPDVGGTDEQMTKLNLAYELLKAGYVKGADGKPVDRNAWFREREKQREIDKAKNKAFVEKVMDDLEDRFKGMVSKTTEHFKDFFVLGSPQISKKLNNYWDNFYGNMIVSWEAEGGKTVIKYVIEISSSLPKGGLSYGEETEYTVSTETIIYHNRKDHKLGLRRTQYGKSTADVFDPEKAFPVAKLNKIISAEKKDVMQKKDFERALRSEFNKFNPSYSYRNCIVVFDLSKECGYFFGVDRIVFNRLASYHVYIYKNTSPEGKSPYLVGANSSTYPDHMQGLGFSLMLPETSTGVELLHSFLDNVAKGKKVTKDWFKPAFDKLEVKESIASLVLKATNIDEANSNTLDALNKALASIEKQFGKDANKSDEKMSFKQYIIQNGGMIEVMMSWAKNGTVDYKKKGSEYHLQKDEFKGILDNIGVSSDASDFKYYEAEAKKVMDGIHKRYENKDITEWPKLDKLYKMMPAYRQRYLKID